MQKRDVDVTIIGAGLTGLTTAFYLAKAGKRVAVIEKEERVGGVIRTRRNDGFIFESGPNTGVYSSPDLVRLFDDLEGTCEPVFANSSAKQRWIWKKGRWHALPSGPVSAVRTPLFTMKDKVRILGEPFREKGRVKEESVAGLVRRRMGKSFLDYAVDPFISGIYAGDPELLITEYALPKLHRLEQDYGGFIRGAIAKRKEPKDELTRRATREVFSVKGGLQELTEGLAEQIGREQICLSASGLNVIRKDKKYRAKFMKDNLQREVVSDHVVSTVSGNATKKIFSFISENELRPILNLRYAKVVQAVALYEKWPGIPVNAFGGLIPSREERSALGILFPSSIFPGRAPEGGAILSVFMGGIRKPEFIEMDDKEIGQIALDEIRSTLDTGSQSPDHLHIYRYPYAIPQYEKSSGERFRAIAQLESQYPGLTLAGNIRDGIGMADRVKQGYASAQKIIREAQEKIIRQSDE